MLGERVVDVHVLDQVGLELEARLVRVRVRVRVRVSDQVGLELEARRAARRREQRLVRGKG